MRRKLVAGLTIALAGAIAASLIYAPYLPRLLREGYPEPIWPAPGYFVTVKGDAASRLFDERPASATLTAELAAAFSEKEGRALLVARDGKLVFEHYAPGMSREVRLNSYSMVKSLVGTLVLKALAEQRIPSLQTPIGHFLKGLPQVSANAAPRRSIADMPLCRFLDMRSGIRFQPDAAKGATGFGSKDFETTKVNVFGPMARLHTGGLAAVGSRLLSDEAGDAVTCDGGSFSYQNVNTALLGAVLEEVYRRPLQDLLSEKIWQPAGAQDALWRRFDEALPVTPYCCLYARPLDWLRVGQFLLDNGTAEQRFLPDELWREFVALNVAPKTLGHGYYHLQAYHDILDRAGARIAGPFTYFLGSRGQVTYLLPQHRLVAVRFGGQMQRLHSTLYGLADSLGGVEFRSTSQ